MGARVRFSQRPSLGCRGASHMLMPEKLRRARLGLTVGRMQTEGEFPGLIIDAVSKGSPVDEKDLAKNDLIVQVDDHELHSVIDFYVTLMHKEVGEPIRLRCVRPTETTAMVRVVELAMLPRPLPDGRLMAQRCRNPERSGALPGNGEGCRWRYGGASNNAYQRGHLRPDRSPFHSVTGGPRAKGPALYALTENGTFGRETSCVSSGDRHRVVPRGIAHTEIERVDIF